MGTEIGFTGSGSLIRIQCGLSMQTTRIALLDCHTAQHSSDPHQGCVEAKWSLDLDLQSASDLDPKSHVESPL